MKRGMWYFAVLVLCLSMCLGAWAEGETGITVTDTVFTGAADSYVHCPVVHVPGNEALSAQINKLLQDESGVMDYINLLPQIEEGSTGLKVSYTLTGEDGPILSLVFSADGKMITGRPSQKYAAVVIDTETGKKVTAEEVFKDLPLLEEMLDTYMDMHVSPLLSTHLENSDLLPVPLDRFSLDEEGITFYYENRQLSFLSGYSGAVTIAYHELKEHLDLSSGSILDRMGIAEMMLEAGDTTGEMVAVAAEKGYLGTLPVRVGMSVEEALLAFRSTVDAGYYPGGAYLEMEASFLRDALVLVDEAEENVTGVMSRRISLYGIISGESTRDEWRRVLGEPQFTLDMDEGVAGAYLLCAGTSDFYDYGEYTLQLHADENGILYAALLTD